MSLLKLKFKISIKTNVKRDNSILQKMPAVYKREVAEEPQPVEDNVELTTKIFVTTEEEVKEGKRLQTS